MAKSNASHVADAAQLGGGTRVDGGASAATSSGERLRAGLAHPSPDHASSTQGKPKFGIVGAVQRHDRPAAVAAVGRLQQMAETHAEASRTADLFRSLATQWRRETAHYSMEWQQTSHPAYQQILAMGPPALPLILEELRDHGGNWFYALGLIARVLGWDDPSEQAETRREAVRAWLAFGRERGLIQSDG